MHPRESPKRVQSRRKTQPGLAPGKALQQPVGRFWGLTRRAGVAKGAGVGATRSKGGCLGKRRNTPLRPWIPRPFG